MARVELAIQFSYPQLIWVGATSTSTTTAESYTVDVPVVGTSVIVSDRDGGPAPTIYAAETGGSTITTLVTDTGGNVPGWINEGSYTVTAAASGPFTGASVAFEAVRGDGVSFVADGAVGVPQLTADLNSRTVPTGTILDYAGSSAPTGYLLCNGAQVGQAAYPALFAKIGSRWNTGTVGAGLFCLPNLINYSTVGAGTVALGSKVGELNHNHATAITIPALTGSTVVTVPSLLVNNHRHGLETDSGVNFSIGNTNGTMVFRWNVNDAIDFTSNRNQTFQVSQLPGYSFNSVPLPPQAIGLAGATDLASATTVAAFATGSVTTTAKAAGTFTSDTDNGPLAGVTKIIKT